MTNCKGTPTHYSWRAMRTRCDNPNFKYFSYYGGRGITYCPAWKTYEGFLADMGERPEGTTLDRIDSDGNYEPANCRWATKSEQMRNRRSITMLTYMDRTQPLAVWAREIGIRRQSLRNRLDRGWTVEQALSTPKRVAKPT